MQRWASVQQVPCSFCHFLNLGPAALRQEGVPVHRIMCVAAAQLQHEVLSSSFPPLSARTVGKHLPLQWLTNYLDFWLEIAIPPQALPAANTVWSLPGGADTESSSFARGTGARSKVLC